MTRTRKPLSLYRTHRSTFHIFPAMIPLIEILPWLLGLIGGLAGGFEFIRENLWQRKRNRWLSLAAVLCLLAAGGVYAVHQARLPAKDTSVAVHPDQYSRLVRATLPPGNAATPLPAKFERLWYEKTTSQFLGNPLATAEMILVGTLDKTLEARRRTDGKKLWTLHKKEPVFTSAFIHGDIGVIGEGLHTAPAATVTAFSVDSGEILWERAFRSHVETAPVLAADGKTIFQAAGAEGVWALDLSSGKVKWHAPIGHIDVRGHSESDALYYPAKLSETEDGSAVFRLDAASGAIAWQTPVEGNPMGDVLPLGNGRMILGTAIGQVGLNKPTDKGWVHCLDSDGKIIWSVELPAMPLPEGQVWPEQQRVFFSLKNGTLLALDTETGKTVWTAPYGGEFRSDAAVLRRADLPLIVAVTVDGFVGIRNALTGEALRGFKLEGGAYTSPLFADDVLYLFEPYGITAYGPVSALGREL